VYINFPIIEPSPKISRFAPQFLIVYFTKSTYPGLQQEFGFLKVGCFFWINSLNGSHPGAKLMYLLLNLGIVSAVKTEGGLK